MWKKGGIITLRWDVINKMLRSPDLRKTLSWHLIRENIFVLQYFGVLMNK